MQALVVGARISYTHNMCLADDRLQAVTPQTATLTTQQLSNTASSCCMALQRTVLLYSLAGTITPTAWAFSNCTFKIAMEWETAPADGRAQYATPDCCGLAL